MMSLINYIKNPFKIGSAILVHYGQWLSDKTYLQLLYYFKMGRRLNLKKPQTFSEKIQWLKLYNRKPEYTKMVDKYMVKEYVAAIIGEDYIIPTLGVWDKPEDIEWNKLPNQFVLKTTHGGGSTSVVICRDKRFFDCENAIKKLNSSMKIDIYRLFREWPYKDVKPRIIAEKYISTDTGTTDLPDYKWYCFNGEPKYCQVIQNRSSKETIDFFDTNWQHQEFVGLNPDVLNASFEPVRPGQLETQISIARELSKNNPFSRIDLYEVDNQVFFGEITFSPRSGFGRFSPEQYDFLLGKMIDLPQITSNNTI